MSAHDSDLEKTEPASQRKLDLAREEGDVPRSRELTACLSLVVGGLLLWMMGAQLQGELSTMLRQSLSFTRAMATDPDLLMEHAVRSGLQMLWVMLPWGAALLLCIALAPLAVGGWLFSLKSLAPQFSRLDPIAGAARMFSVQALAELGKSVLKALLVGVVTWVVLSRQQGELLMLTTLPVKEQAHALGRLLMAIFFPLAGTLALIAAIDVPLQRWRHAKKLMMTREEVRQEHKEQEGNPEIKARIRAQQREMARRRMMAAIPTADVVITNPTHYAVALSYAEKSNAAPVVVAKGADEVAAKIRAIAAEHQVPLLESPPLARALYRHAELGDAIPERLYTAVAQVLAYVFQLRAGAQPTLPEAIVVPADMDIPAMG